MCLTTSTSLMRKSIAIILFGRRHLPLSAVNWSNIAMLGAIGLVLDGEQSPGWADTNVAATHSLTLLFLRTPPFSAGALSTLLTAQVAFTG